MSRAAMTFFIAWLITRLFHWASGFEPIRDLKGILGYSVDLAIWLAVCIIIYWLLGALRIGKKSR
jgi:hypothetical protein